MDKDELILEYEEDIVILKARITELERQLAEAQTKLSLVWPGVWQPIMDTEANHGDDYEIIDPEAEDDRRLYVDDDGSTLTFSIEGGVLEGTFMLPDGYALCRKVTP